MGPAAPRVHIVWGRLPVDPAAIVARDVSLLSAEERERMETYSSPMRGLGFAAGRIWLRRVLAEYTGQAPPDLAIEAPRHEKPRLTSTAGRDVRFNLAHAADVIVCAVSEGVEVGVDVEASRDGAATALRRTILSPGEQAVVAALPDAAVDGAVMRQWVRKEAVLKGLGQGLRRPPAHLDLGLDPATAATQAAAVVDGVTWTVADLNAGEGFFAAVAVVGTGIAVVEHDADVD